VRIRHDDSANVTLSMFSFARFLALLSDPQIVRRSLAAFLVLGAFGAWYLAQHDSEETSALRRGDFPAFWSMAVIASGPEPHRLYDLELQRQVQNEAWPSLKGAVLPAAYPPQVAFVLRPLAQVDHQTARLIWTGCNLVAVIVACVLLVRRNGTILWAPWMVFSLLCIFSPVLRGILGGQVLSFVMLLFALTAALERRNSWRADLFLGLVLGVWLCKPYYALCALAVPVMQRRWVVLLSFSVVAAVSWWAARRVMGPGWFSAWAAFAQTFAAINMETNAHQMPNLWAQVYRLSGASERLGVAWWALVMGAYGTCLGGVYALLGTRCVRVLLSTPRRNGDLLLMLIFALLVVLMPQVNFYDLGLMACTVLVLFRPGHRTDWWFVGMCLVLSQFGVSPLFGVPIHFIIALSGLAHVCLRVRRCTSLLSGAVGQ